MKVLCFGDSNTYGYDPRSYFGGRYGADSRWVDLLARKTGWEVENLGEPGREIPQTAPAFPPGLDLLLCMLGTNDLLQGRSPTETTARMERFLKSVPLERKKIFLIAPPPMARGTWVPDTKLIDDSKALAQGYRALAGRLGVRFADAGAWGVSLAYDGVHFTQQGHKAFAEGIFKALFQ